MLGESICYNVKNNCDELAMRSITPYHLHTYPLCVCD